MKKHSDPDDKSLPYRMKSRVLITSRLLWVAVWMLLGMTAYEALKQLLLPTITVWESHVITIVFSTGIAVVAALVITRKNDHLLEQVARENTLRRQQEEDCRQSEEKFVKLFRANPDWVIMSSLEDGRYIDVNDAFLRMTGYRKEEIIGRTSAELAIWVDPKERQAMIPRLRREGRISNHDVSFRMKSGESRSMLRSAELIELEGEPVIISVCKDITARIQAEKEREVLIKRLEASLSKVKLLSGMLPICSSCKRIRDEQGNWFQIEAYIKERSEAHFTHGICQDCADKFYPDFSKNKGCRGG